METLVNLIPWPTGRELLRLMRVDRPIGTWLLLWPSLWAVAAATPGIPDWRILILFTVGAFIMRSAGCVANDIADQEFDPHVERTRNRPLAAHRVSEHLALVTLLLLLFTALGIAFLLNRLAVQLAFAGAFLAVSYPFTKRFIDIPQFYMGAAFGWGVIIAWAAMTGEVTPEAWLLFAATLAWAAGYDTVYALMDREDDLKIGVRSTAILFGRYDLHAVTLLYGLALLLLFIAGTRLHLGPLYNLSLLAALTQMAWQLVTIKDHDRAAVFRAFLSNRWVGLLLFAGFVLGDLP